MPEEFRWTPKIIIWLIIVVIVCSVISYNLPEHPEPNRTVYLTGYQFIEFAIYLFGAAMILAAIRKRRLFLDFKVNWLEGFIALNGVALFASPFAAMFVKLIIL